MKTLSCIPKLFAMPSVFQIVYHVSAAGYTNRDAAGGKYLCGQLSELIGVEMKLCTDTTPETEYEILLGTEPMNRDAFREAFSCLKGELDYAVKVGEKKIVVAATEYKSLAQALEYLITRILVPAKNHEEKALLSGSYVHSQSDEPFVISTERLRELYPKAVNCYSVAYGWWWDYEVSSEGRKDQKLVQALRMAMGSCAVFCVGKTVVLYDGYIRKLDPGDYCACAKFVDGVLMIPSTFLNFYFATSRYEGSVPLTEAAKENGYFVFRYGDLAILSKLDAHSFALDREGIGEYSNHTMLERMKLFFENPQMPEPHRDTEQTRVVVEDAIHYYPEDSLDSAEPTYISYYSPGIVVTQNEDGHTVMYASNEHCQVKAGAEPSSATAIHKSIDGGKTWSRVHFIERLKWATIFMVEKQMYIVGFLKDEGIWRGDTVIGKVAENEPVELHILRANAEVSCFSPLVANGNVYMPLDFGMASADINSDLLNAENWTVTQSWNQLVNQEWFVGITGKSLARTGTIQCMEASAVVGRDGRIYGVYRTECQPNGNYAILFRLSKDCSRLELLPDNASLIRLPTTVSRFIIRYDDVSDQYICLSNWWLTPNACRARNALGLSVSKDLTNWSMVELLLADRELMNSECACWKNAFQYQDMDFDGDDIVMTVREATGFTNIFHDGKYLTFYRVKNFRKYLTDQDMIQKNARYRLD